MIKYQKKIQPIIFFIKTYFTYIYHTLKKISENWKVLYVKTNLLYSTNPLESVHSF